MVLNYYPGCTLKNQAADLDHYARVSAEALGITLAELPQWQCCGGVYPMAADEIATRLSAVRAPGRSRNGNAGDGLLGLPPGAETNQPGPEAGRDISRPGQSLYGRAPALCGADPGGPLSELLRDTVGFDRLKEAVKRPLTGRKIGAYYGCLLLRPRKDMDMDDPENPRIFGGLPPGPGCGAGDLRHAQRMLRAAT